jgi:hypothetical protein
LATFRLGQRQQDQGNTHLSLVLTSNGANCHAEQTTPIFILFFWKKAEKKSGHCIFHLVAHI